MASFSNSWGFGQKTKDSSSAPPHDLNVGKHSKKLSMNIPNLTKTYKASCILSITGDYERETSAFIVSRFLLQTTQMLAYPSPDTEDESRNVIVLMHDVDNQHEDDDKFCREPYCFELYMLRKRVILKAANHNDCDNWVAALQKRKHLAIREGLGHSPLDKRVQELNHYAKKQVDQRLEREVMEAESMIKEGNDLMGRSSSTTTDTFNPMATRSGASR